MLKNAAELAFEYFSATNMYAAGPGNPSVSHAFAGETLTSLDGSVQPSVHSEQQASVRAFLLATIQALHATVHSSQAPLIMDMEAGLLTELSAIELRYVFIN